MALNTFMLGVVMLSVVMLNVIMLSVVAPCSKATKLAKVIKLPVL